MVPCFALMASIGLWVERDFASDIETQDLAQRVGSLAGKIAISMNRHDAANQPQLAQDLLAPLGHEPSVVCAEYQASGQLVARYPQGLGCRNAVFDDSIDLALGPETFLRVALTEDNWQALVHAQLRNSMISQAAAFVVALIAASIGFQILVSRRLARLNQAIRRAVIKRERITIDEKGRDEISELVVEYNRLAKIETQLEDALRQRNQEITQASQTDALTGLYNRVYCQRHLSPAPVPDVDMTTLAVLIDIDHFKQINDTYGHQVGDQVLKEMGQRLTNTLRTDSTAIRWGGEEFLVLINNIPAESAHKVVERLLNAIRQTPFTTDEGPLAVTASLGGCPIDVIDSRDLENILIWADRALYLSKQQGRNRACLVWSTKDRQGQLIPQNLTGGELEWIGILPSTSHTVGSNDMRHAS